MCKEKTYLGLTEKDIERSLKARKERKIITQREDKRHILIQFFYLVS